MCFFGHQWGRWKIISEYVITRWNHTRQKEQEVGKTLVQERVCDRCGYTRRCTEDVWI